MVAQSAADGYRARAGDSSLAKPLREAAELQAKAEEMLEKDCACEALDTASEALKLFKQVLPQGNFGVADAARAMAAALIASDRRKEANSLAKEELQKFQEAGDREGAAKMLLALAEVNGDKRGPKNRELALDYAEEARAEFQELGMQRFEALALLALANARLKSPGQEALEPAEDAEQLFHEAGDSKGEALALHAMALAKLQLEDAGGAVETAKRALELFRELGLGALQAVEEACIADWLLRHGQEEEDANEAVEAAQNAQTSFQQLGDNGCKSLATDTLVRAMLAAGQQDRGFLLAQQRLEEAKQKGEKAAEAAAQHGLVAAHLARQDTDSALQAAKASIELYKGLDDARGEAAAFHLVAQLHLRKGTSDQASKAASAASSAREAMARVAKDAARPEEEVMILQTLAAAHLAKGDAKSALEATSAGKDIAKQAEAPGAEASCLMREAGALVLQGDLEAAVAAASEAQELLREANDPRAEAGAAHFIARVQLERQDYDSARVAADTARALLRQCGEDGREVGMLILSTQAGSMELAAGAQPRGAGQAARAFFEGRGRQKVFSTAKEAVALSKRLGGPSGLFLQAIARFSLARAYVCSGLVTEAASELAEAMPVFSQSGDRRAEASAKLLHANISLLSGKRDIAMSASKEALNMFNSMGDSHGASLVDAFYSKLQAAAKAAAPAPAAAPVPTVAVSVAPSATEAAPDGDALARPAALDKMKMALPDRVKYSLTQLVAEAIGMDHVEEDKTLMETGMTSIASIMLRDKIQAEFPEIPEMDLTFVFDYPTIRDMTGFVLQSLPDDA
eukprot:TRINITY_DN11326_c0_g1_i1.p1 TRINITY_DN11326_c0_g1~~TRINITY_DN11326_c0_g1_i1.p1  ORF type:complete len:818 (+),score=253.41 TRINITY_DN11326_c0_g1_i1:45-2456(+)